MSTWYIVSQIGEVLCFSQETSFTEETSQMGSRPTCVCSLLVL